MKRNLPVNPMATATVHVLPIAFVLIAIAAAFVTMLAWGGAHFVLGVFVTGGMMTFIALPFILAAITDESDRITGQHH